MCFEDAHWIDSKTWDIIQDVVATLSNRCVIIVATRPPELSSIDRQGGLDSNLVADGEEKHSGRQLVTDRVKFANILRGLKGKHNEFSVTVITLENVDAAAGRAAHPGRPRRQMDRPVLESARKCWNPKT